MYLGPIFQLLRGNGEVRLLPHAYPAVGST